VGYHASPLGFPPFEFFGQGRFDGPPDLFRTLYCSESPLTCLRETLFKFRPSVKARSDFARLGKPTWPDVTAAWRRENVLISAELKIPSRDLLSLDDQSLLVSLEVELADLLLDLGVEHLTLGEIQGGERELTQAIARVLFLRGAAGLLFPSRYDGGPCAALFEGRAWLLGRSAPQSFTGAQPEFEQVCREYGLTLEV
jgi:RES domain